MLAGEPLTYTLYLTNHGPQAATPAVVTATLPISLTDVLCRTSQAGACVVAWRQRNGDLRNHPGR